MDCEATTKEGAACRAPAMTGRTFCFHHDPEKAGERAAARRRGGLVLHHGTADRVPPEVAIGAVRDVLELLETAASDALSRKPGIERARCLTYVAGAALKALEVGALEERVAALEARLTLEKAS